MSEHQVDVLAVFGVVGALVGVVGYLRLAAVRRRGWPRRRTAAWLVGIVVALATVVGPLARAADTSFPAHMVVHLLLGMLAPLLLILAAPVTLVLRAVPVRTARRIVRALSTWPARVLTEPVVAAVLATGGMVLLYLTPLYPAMPDHPVLHVLVHAHLFVSGYLFAVAIVGVDPTPHRRSYPHRTAVLVLGLAVHDIVAKYLYAHPPVGVDATAAVAGSMIMYYGGDAVEVMIMVLLGARWYRATRPRPRRVPVSVAAPS